jgi:two-component system sensor histidine kinase/response regulator
MRYFGDRVDVYRRVLQQFVLRYDDGLGSLDLHPNAPDQAETLRELHSIKSAAATIGALRLPQLAERLEAAIDHHAAEAELAAAAQALQDELRLLVSSIRDASADLAPTKHDDGAASKASLDRLEQLLVSADYQAAVLFRELQDALARQHGDAVEDIAAAMRRFDYDQALAELRRLRAAAVA